MPHIQLMLNQNKLSLTWDIMSLNNGQKCRKPVFMRASGICFIKWLWFGSICGESNEVISFEKVKKKEEGTSYVANKRRSTEVNS